MHDPKWGIFYDFHTMPACPDVGATFDAEAFADRLQACGVDYTVFHARCNLGMAYYNTKVGIRHPSLTYDMFGALAEACEKRGIALGAYINVGLSHEEALLHRDWAVVTAEGYVYQPDRMGHWFRSMCYNTAYGEHVLEMVRELVTGYPIAGLFFDCMVVPPCVGVECVREMKELGMDWADPAQLEEFGRLTRVRMAKRIAETAKGLDPELLIYFNGVEWEYQQDLGTYLEFECLPTGGWGYEQLPLFGRHLRKLGKPLLNMTGRFHRSWGDFGGIRTEPSLEYDVVHGLALGMRTTIGDHFHPRGDINHAVFDLIERIYKRQQRLEPWLEGAEGNADVAVVVPEPGFRYLPREARQRAVAAATGACRVLCELKQQFDVLTPALPWEGYRTLVLPDFVTLEAEAAGKLRAHLAAGGTILSSGWSGLDPEHKGFVMEEWPARYTGDDPWDPAFLVAGAGLAEGMPDMPVTLYDQGIAMEAESGAEVLGEIMAPYYNRQFDGEHGFLYLPPAELTGRPAVALRGPVAQVSHPIFTSYYNYAPVPMKQVVAHLLKRLLPDPMVLAPGLPTFARAMVTAQPGRRMVWLLSYVPERRGPNMDMIEEPIELREVALALRTGERPPRRVYLAPEERELEWEIRDGYVWTSVPAVPGYAVVVFEE